MSAQPTSAAALPGRAPGARRPAEPARRRRLGAFGPLQVLMLAPAQGLLIAAIAVPALYVLWLSFTESTYGSTPTFVGFANYLDMWDDRYFWRAMVNTLVVINVIIYVELALALMVALAFAAGVPFKKVLIAIVLMPYAISEVVAIVIWKFMMDPAAGVIAHGLASLGLPQLNWAVDPVAGLTLVSIVSIWLHLPFTFVLVYAAILSIPGELPEAAHADGATSWQRFRYVTLPFILPTVLIALIFRYILAFRLFTEVWLLTNGGPARTTEVMAIYLYKQAFTYADFGRGAAAGWVMVLTSGLIAGAFLWAAYNRGFGARG